MRSFNNTMAEDNYNTSQSNLNADSQPQQQQQQSRRKRSQQSADELAALAAEHQQLTSGLSTSAKTTRIADEMSQDLQYLSREAPLDGGESTFGAYSTLGGSQQQQPAGNKNVATMSHQATYTSMMTTQRATTPGAAGEDFLESESDRAQLENDYERTDFRIDGDDDATQVYDYNQQMRPGSGGGGSHSMAESPFRDQQQQQQQQLQLEQLAPDNVDIQRPLQQAGLIESPTTPTELAEKFREHHQLALEQQLLEESRVEIENGKLDSAPRVEEPIRLVGLVESEQTMTSKGNESAMDIKQQTLQNVESSLARLKPFLVSFMVDARGGAMRGCRHSGVRVIIPPNTAPQPMRITCRYLRRDRLVHPPPLMEGEACASKIMEVGPAGAKFLGPVLIEVPHFASLRGKEREIIILRSDSGEVWREHLVEADENLIDSIIKSAELVEQQQQYPASDQENQRPSSAIGQSQDGGIGGGGDPQQQQEKRLTRIVTNEFPQYFAIISRIRQQVHTIGPDGSVVDSQVVPRVQAIFTDGALTKRIKIGLQKKNASPDESSQLGAKELDETQETQQHSQATQQAEERARSPSTGRPGSSAAKRRSRFLACFWSGHGSHELLDQSGTDAEGFASGSNESSLAGGDSPRQPVNGKLAERRHILGEVTDSEEGDSNPLKSPSKRAIRKRSVGTGTGTELVPDDYYIEQEPPLILNIRPKTYGKRLASSSAQTDQKLQVNGFMSTSAKSTEGKRRGVNLLGGGKRRRNKTQMQIPYHEPTAAQQQRQQQSSRQKRPKSTDLGALTADSSLESSHYNEELDEQMNSSLNDLMLTDDDSNQKWRTCTIQTDSDSVTVQYVTISSLADGGAAAAAAATTTTTTGHDDGYVSGSGDLKKGDPAAAALQTTTHKTGHKSVSLFSPFCASSKVADDDDDEEKSAGNLSMDEQHLSEGASNHTRKQKKAEAKSQKKAASKKSSGSGKSSPEKLDIVLETKTPEPSEQPQQQQPPSAIACEPLAPPKGVELSTTTTASVASPELASGGEEADESVISRSASPTSKQLKLRLKLEKQEKLKMEKLEKQKQKELEEANAKAEKAKRKLEKEAKKKAEKAEKLAKKASAQSPSGSRTQSPEPSTVTSSTLKLDPETSSTADETISKSSAKDTTSGTLTKTSQSVKFAPSPSRDQHGKTVQEDEDDNDHQADDDKSAASSVSVEGGGSERKSPTSKLLDSMSSMLKVKLPKINAGHKKSTSLDSDKGASLEHASEPLPIDSEDSAEMVHVSIGADSSLSSDRQLKHDDDTDGNQQQLISFSSEVETISAPAAKLHSSEPVKVLKPILKQKSSSFDEQPQSAEIIISEPKALSLIASQLVEEVTEEAVRMADALQSGQSPSSGLSSPTLTSSASESRNEAAKRLKADKDHFKAELKLKLDEEKRLTKEAKRMAKQAEEAAKRAEHEAKKATHEALEEAERQAKIAKEEAERAIKLAAQQTSDNLDQSEDPASLKKRIKEAEAETRRLAKESEAEAKKKAREARAEADRLASEAKKQLKLDKKKLKLRVDVIGADLDPSAPSIELVSSGQDESPRSSPPEQHDPQTSSSSDSKRISTEIASVPSDSGRQKRHTDGQEEEVEEQEKPVEAEHQSSTGKKSGGFAFKLPEFNLKLKKSGDHGDKDAKVDQPEAKTEVDESKKDEKEKKQKQKKKKTKTKRSGAQMKQKDKTAGETESISSKSSDDEQTSATETVSKSSFLSRLFKSRPKPVEVELPSSSVDQAAKADLKRQPEQEHQMIVSEMYPSDPNNVDGEMILEVNVPENLISESCKPTSESVQQQQPHDERLATTVVTSVLTNGSQQAAEPTDDQEATLVNLSQMVDDEVGPDDDDDATENVVSQATNDLLLSQGHDNLEIDLESPKTQAAHLDTVIVEDPRQVHSLDRTVSLELPSGAAEVTDLPETSTQQEVSAVGVSKQAAKDLAKDEKSRKELEAKLEKEAKKRAKEEEKARKKQEKEDKKRAELEAKQRAKDEKERLKREAKEAKRLAELAKKETKSSKKNKQLEVVAQTSSSPIIEEPDTTRTTTTTETQEDDEDSKPTTITTTTVTSTTVTTGDDKTLNADIGDGLGGDDDQVRILMSSSSEVPIDEATEVERVVEEVLGEDGTLTKTTKTVETKYVTMRQEEIRVAERRDIPVEEWERIQSERAERQAATSSSAGEYIERSAAPAQYATPELDEIRATPSYFDPTQELADIKPDTAPRKALQKRIKLNQKLIKRAYKLARSECKRAKREQRKAELEIAVCDEAAREARKELKRAVKEAKRAAKAAEKEHKQMDKMDKKLAKRQKKLEKRQKKIDKRMAKLAKKQEREAKKVSKLQRAGSSSSRSPSRSSKKSIKLEDIGQPILHSSSRLSIQNQASGSQQQQKLPADETRRRSSQLEPAAGQAAEADLQVDLSLDDSAIRQPVAQHQQHNLTQDQVEQLVRDGELHVVHTITKTIVTEAGEEGGEPQVHTSQETRVLTGREAEDAAMRMELEAARDEEIIDVVGDYLDEVEQEQLQQQLSSSSASNSRQESQEKENDGQSPSTPSKSKAKKNKKRSKKQNSKEVAQ